MMRTETVYETQVCVCLQQHYLGLQRGHMTKGSFICSYPKQWYSWSLCSYLFIMDLQQRRHVYNCKCWKYVYLFFFIKFIEILKWLVLYLLNDSKHPIVVLLSTNFGSCVWFFKFQIHLSVADICKIVYGRVSGGEHSSN